MKEDKGARKLLKKALDQVEDGNWEEVEELASKAREKYDQKKDKNGSLEAFALVLRAKARDFEETQDYRNAAGALTRAVLIYTKLGMIEENVHLIKKQAYDLEQSGQQNMRQKKFIEAAVDFEQAAIAHFKNNERVGQVECRAKAYICRAAVEKSISGRKNFLRQAISLFQNVGIRTPLIQGHMEYYTGLFQQLEDTQSAKKHFQLAKSYYSQANYQQGVKRIESLISMMKDEQKEEKVGFNM